MGCVPAISTRRAALISGLILAAVLAVVLPKRSSTLPSPQLAVQFLGYTNGIMGKRFAVITVTNVAAFPVRIWPNVTLQYGLPMTGPPFETYGFVERVLEPGCGFLGQAEVITESSSKLPKWRLGIRMSLATKGERLARWWDEWTYTNGWIWNVTLPVHSKPKSTFTTDWLGP